MPIDQTELTLIQVAWSENKEAILNAIECLKLGKPDDWKKKVRFLIKELRRLEDPYMVHENHGSESRGRHVHRTDGCPIYDAMGDESCP